MPLGELYPFRRADAIPGTRLVLASDPSVAFEFIGFGHYGNVIARRLKPVPGRPDDVIARQQDFLMTTAGGGDSNPLGS